MVRLAFLLLVLLASPARADVFDDAAGLWGMTNDPLLTCTENPHSVSFSEDRSRAYFRWDHEMTNYLGEPDLEGAYAVLDHDSDRIVLALDGEQRLDRFGRPVVWIMRLFDGGRSYCWGRTDWPAEDCIDGYVRCRAPPPVS